LIGDTHPGPEKGSVVVRTEARIKAGGLFAAPVAGNDLADHAGHTFSLLCLISTGGASTFGAPVSAVTSSGPLPD